MIAAGTRLGPYEVVAPLGAGGMGEVWRGRDTRLERSVAIKILPAELAENAQFKLRFEREAKTISQLNHPHICTLYDVGENYLVMELLEGESLADRLTKGPLPLEQVLRYGVQIADALDKAHRAGIVHRDLKPGNIMITKSGAKLLDFGLAKSGGQPPPAVLEGATQHKPLTQEGTILGTFQYMAPEQLEGEEADARTDIFGFGAVLYEMATGSRAFEGKTKTSLIAAIVSSEPKPMSQIQPLTPPALEHVVRKCLAKERDDRWQSAHDIAEELRWISEAGSSAGVAAPLIARRKSRERLGWVAAVAVAGGAAVFFATRRPDPPPRVETAVVPPEGVAFSYVGGSIALSDDGRQVAFVGRGADGKSLIWVRSLGSSVVRPLAGTEGASFPFWSPDAKYIAFATGDKLKKVSVTGGSPETLADAPRFLGGSWNRSGDILFSNNSIQRVPATGGKVDGIIAGGNRVLSSPRFLPDGRRFLFTSLRGTSQTDGLYVASLDEREEKMVLPGVYSNAAYAPPGFILYSRDGDLRAQRVDPKMLKAEGDPIRLADRVQYDPDSKAALFAVSDTGSLLYLEGEGAGKSELAWVSRDGKTLGTIAPPAMFYSPRLSHDEKRVAVDLSDTQTASGDVWMFDLVHGVSTRLTYDPANESAPNWSPDDRRIFFFSEKRGHLDLYDRASSGTGAEELLLADGTVKIPLDVSPDGQLLAYTVVDPAQKNSDVWLMRLATRKTTPLLTTPFNEGALSFSPDGKWIVFSSDESGRSEIYVQQFPDSTGKWIVSRGGGSTPAWNADGRQIYYISPERKMMSLPVSLGASFDAGTPVALFDARLREVGGEGRYRQYAITRNGSKFLLNRNVGEEGTRPMTLVQSWWSQLERR